MNLLYIKIKEINFISCKICFYQNFYQKWILPNSSLHQKFASTKNSGVEKTCLMKNYGLQNKWFQPYRLIFLVNLTENLGSDYYKMN